VHVHLTKTLEKIQNKRMSTAVSYYSVNMKFQFTKLYTGRWKNSPTTMGDISK